MRQAVSKTGPCISDVTFLYDPTAERAVTSCAWDSLIYDDEPNSLWKPAGRKTRITSHGLTHRYGKQAFAPTLHGFPRPLKTRLECIARYNEDYTAHLLGNQSFLSCSCVRGLWLPFLAASHGLHDHVKSLRNALGDRPTILRKATLNELV